MTIITPNVVSQGGSIHVFYAPDQTSGISSPVTLGLVLSLNPSTNTPFALVTLELPAGDFTFSNGTTLQTKDLGLIGNDEAVNITFKIICDKLEPPSTLGLLIRAADRFGFPSPDVAVTYPVKKEVSTANNVRLLFLS